MMYLVIYNDNKHAFLIEYRFKDQHIKMNKINSASNEIYELETNTK
jgi:hypothetical protein